MDEQTTTGPRERDTGPSRTRFRRGGPIYLAALAGLAVVAAFAVLRAPGSAPSGPPGTAGPATPGPSADPPATGGPAIGGIATLAEGGVARLNGVVSGIIPEAGSAPPETGMRLDRLDVEICAGSADLFVDAAFWNGLGTDQRVHSAHMSVRRFVTLTMAPGSCQRGSVDLAVPEGVDLEGVLLMDTSQTTAARWTVTGTALEAAPLASAVRGDRAAIGTTVDLVVGGSATLHTVDLGARPSADGTRPPTGLVRLGAEQCAGSEAIPTSPRHWFLELEDNRLVSADVETSTMEATTIGPRGCAGGALDFRVPDGSLPVGARYAYGGQFELARWALDR